MTDPLPASPVNLTHPRRHLPWLAEQVCCWGSYLNHEDVTVRMIGLQALQEYIEMALSAEETLAAKILANGTSNPLRKRTFTQVVAHMRRPR